MAIPLFPKRKDKDDGDLAGEDAKNSGLKEALGLLGSMQQVHLLNRELTPRYSTG